MEIWRQVYLSLSAALGKIHRPEFLLPWRRETSNWEEVKATSCVGDSWGWWFGGLVVGDEKNLKILGLTRGGVERVKEHSTPGSTPSPIRDWNGWWCWSLAR